MNDYLICGGQLVTSSGTVPNKGLLIRRGKIAVPGAPNPDSIYGGLCCTVRPKTSDPHSSKSEAARVCCSKDDCSRDCIEIDGKGLLISPGFIDLHVHGGMGCDTLDGTADSIKKIAAYHVRGGTTSFLATLAPSTSAKLKKALLTVSAFVMRINEGAQLIGAHMEGPHLNPARAGAINPAYLKEISIKEMNEFINLSEGFLRMVTLAPELPGSIRLIKMLSKEGIVVAAGHTEATYEISMSSFKAGVRHAIHLFNASSPLHHREPGLVGAVLASKDITAEIIVDDHHLHPSVLKLLYSVKGNRGLTLATDAVSAAGMPDGEYLFNDRKITMKNGKINLTEGPVAGSSLTMIDAVKNMVNKAGIPIHEAVRMASLNPARLLGKENTKGALAPGMDADLVLLDKELNVKLTMVNGHIVYNSLF